MNKNNPALDDSVSVWIDELKNADDRAAEKLWNHFFRRLYKSARQKIQQNTLPVYNEEDAAQSAFQSLCAGLAEGRFPDLDDRQSLWRLLLVITSRKIARRHKYEHRQLRDTDRTVGEGSFSDGKQGKSQVSAMQGLLSREPTPEFAVEFAETLESLFLRLNDPKLQQIVKFRMDGCSDSEIGDRLNCSRRTVQRSLEVIRRRWNKPESADE